MFQDENNETLDQTNSTHFVSGDFKPVTQFSAGSQQTRAHAGSAAGSNRLSGLLTTSPFKPRMSKLLSNHRAGGLHNNHSRGAVRLEKSDNQKARRSLFLLAIGCVATSGIIYGAKLADSVGISPLAVKGSLQSPFLNGRSEPARLADNPLLPKPVPQPSFRFDDADPAIWQATVASMQAQNRPDNNGYVRPSFPPHAIFDRNNERNVEIFKVDAALEQAMRDAEHNLPPLQSSVPHQTLAVQDEPALQDDFKKVVEVQPGDSFSKILNDNGISRSDLPSLEEHNLVQRYLTKLKVGQKMDFTYSWQSDFKSLNIKVSRDTRILLSKHENGYTLEKIHLPLEYERVVTSGTIDQSLYLAAEKAKLDQSTIMTLADIFQWELDFTNDIRKGDHFSIVYDRLYRDGKYVGDGEILAAEFVRGDRVHRAIRFTNDDDVTAYYSPDGKAKGRSFNRHPVEIVRITSKFDPNRMHPVLHQIRAHKGVDYGAPHGSPIRAVADGHISYSGSRNAYGNTVIIKHDSKRTTLYAHMSRIDKKSKVGKKIKRGDVIGYVGKTGRVTGTHLHYELRINGKHVDPLKVELPSPPPLAAKDLPRLKAISSELVAQMRSVNEMVSQAPEEDTEALMGF